MESRVTDGCKPGEVCCGRGYDMDKVLELF
jgi:hypothetical protein